jgi:hypothetical protein
MPAGAVLPQSVGFYLALMIAGFVIGALGHLFESRAMVALGVGLVFAATLLLPLALNLLSEHPAPPPGPVPPP